LSFGGSSLEPPEKNLGVARLRKDAILGERRAAKIA
jgi:hypothetical protein